MAKHPTNVMARYHGGVREMKGQRLMLQRMLQLPTVNGQFLSTVLEPDQVAVFDKALALADALAAKTIECRVPLLQLVRMEAMVREQETRCYVAWVGSAQHLAALIRMSFVRRTSVAVRHSLRTSTEMDGTIRTVQRMLQESAAAGDGACAVVAAASASAGSLTDVTR